jgi:hypothetical protein
MSMSSERNVVDKVMLPETHGCKLWSWVAGDRAEIQPIDSLRKYINNPCRECGKECGRN